MMNSFKYLLDFYLQFDEFLHYILSFSLLYLWFQISDNLHYFYSKITHFIVFMIESKSTT
jgi:hypothetical protein